MKLKYLILIPCMLHFSLTLSPAATINVPLDYPTIQAGIDAAVDADTVLVASGTYTGDGNRDIDFLGKAIVVMSEEGPDSATIDCGTVGRAVNFRLGEDFDSKLMGFTLSNWRNPTDPPMGGAIYFYDSAPVIQNCIIKNNFANNAGAI